MCGTVGSPWGRVGRAGWEGWGRRPVVWNGEAPPWVGREWASVLDEAWGREGMGGQGMAMVLQVERGGRVGVL